jgi:hypothetical protein
LSILSRRGYFNQKLIQSGIAAQAQSTVEDVVLFSSVSLFHAVLLLTTLMPAMGAPLCPNTHLSISLQRTEMEVSRQSYCA